ncbi:glycosyl transferase family protein [Thalassolituus marinus]|uniref:Glycosyl transferase family protein n=1 Tax=Thalassolituus marinus TaxID=671053 RepID=A0ABS7ZUR5_9GAMM|nr:glycosyl transferase family protein [Thalassolituus marinus]MCA6064141.1 glycosyl transferase family protein [Thalassolituus marinus]
MSHPLADYVRILARGKNGSRSMTFEEARFTMQHMLSGDALPEQIGAIFMLMRVKEESPEELAGFAAAINELWPENLNADLIWPSYAGKRRQPFWCFLSMVLLQQMGYRILVHGTEAHTAGRLYLHEVFSAFGLEHLSEAQQFNTSTGLAYLPCSAINPGLQQWLGLKSVLGVRSPINTVMKTIAPAGIPSVQGVFHPGYAPVHAQAAAINQRECVVIKGEGGEFEVNPERTCKAQLCISGELSELSIANKTSHYEDKFSEPTIDALKQVWRGESADDYALEAILNTAALALCIIKRNNDVDANRLAAEQAWSERNKESLG